MNKLTKIILLAITVPPLSILAVYVALVTFASWSQGYSWKEMDWNEDGNTSAWEFLAASDVGKRLIDKDGKHCDEFYAMKDGLPIKVVCR